jgi:hypothetical protein
MEPFMAEAEAEAVGASMDLLLEREEMALLALLL